MKFSMQGTHAWGTITEWMAVLTKDDLHAIINHENPGYNGEDWARMKDKGALPPAPGDPIDIDVIDCGCLVGCVILHRFKRLPAKDRPSIHWPAPFFNRQFLGLQDDDSLAIWEEAGYAFPTLTERFGAEETWVALKEHAQKLLDQNP